MTAGLEGGDEWGERLPRRLGPWSATAVVIGATIGSGIFRTPAIVAEQIHSVPVFMGAWALGAVIALCGALSFAELSTMFPRSGGMYVYLREAFGRPVAFLFGWSELVLLRPAAYGAVALTCSEYGLLLAGVSASEPLVPGLVSRGQVVAAILILAVGLINMRGVAAGAIAQNISTVLKIAALAVMMAIGVQYLSGGSSSAAAKSVESATQAGAFGLAMVSVLWAYDGWSDVGFVSGEVQRPAHTLPRAFFVGTLVVALLYVATNWAYLAVVPLTAMPGAKLIAADVARTVVGPWGAAFVAGAVAISTFGTLNASMMTSPRVFFAMAEDKLFFSALAQVDPVRKSPSRAVTLGVGLGVVFVLFGEFSALADRFVLGIWPFYALSVGAVFILRHRLPQQVRSYRTWGYPWVPATFLAATGYVLGSYMLSDALAFTGNILAIATGVPVYWLWVRLRGKKAM